MSTNINKKNLQRQKKALILLSKSLISVGKAFGGNYVVTHTEEDEAPKLSVRTASVLSLLGSLSGSQDPNIQNIPIPNQPPRLLRKG